VQTVELEDGEVVNAYKHRWTRRCVHLDRRGGAFAYMEGAGYREVDPNAAINAVFAGWECELEPSERATLRAALDRCPGGRRSDRSDHVR